MKRSLLSVIFLLVFAISAHAKDEAPASVGLQMTAAAQKFLASLTPEQAAKTTLAFDDPKRLDWHNIPKPERKGLQIREMSVEQRKLCHALLKAALSESGYEKAVRIMSLEQNLLIGEQGKGPFRDPERYFLTIFGKPEAQGTWGWSFEGHHFSLNFVVKDGKVIGDTPSFWGANPATVHVFVEGGPEKGTRTLADEEQKAFDLLATLSDEQRKKTIIAEKAPDDYRAAGQPKPPQGKAEGMAAAEMTAEQKQILRDLLSAYLGHLEPEVAAARIAEVESSGLDGVHFAWAGATKPGVGHYYRVQGPTFVLELVNIQSDPAGNPANHIHSVWRSLTNDFGVVQK